MEEIPKKAEQVIPPAKHDEGVPIRDRFLLAEAALFMTPALRMLIVNQPSIVRLIPVQLALKLVWSQQPRRGGCTICPNPIRLKGSTSCTGGLGSSLLKKDLLLAMTALMDFIGCRVHGCPHARCLAGLGTTKKQSMQCVSGKYQAENAYSSSGKHIKPAVRDSMPQIVRCLVKHVPNLGFSLQTQIRATHVQNAMQEPRLALNLMDAIIAKQASIECLE